MMWEKKEARTVIMLEAEIKYGLYDYSMYGKYLKR